MSYEKRIENLRLVWLAVAIALLLLIIASATFLAASIVNNQATLTAIVQTAKSVYETNTFVPLRLADTSTPKPRTATPAH
jgi:hypothetical protein